MRPALQPSVSTCGPTRIGPSWNRRRSWAPCGRMQPLRGSHAAALSMSGSRARFWPTAWRISPRSTSGTFKVLALGACGTHWLDHYWPQSSPTDWKQPTDHHRHSGLTPFSSSFSARSPSRPPPCQPSPTPTGAPRISHLCCAKFVS